MNDKKILIAQEINRVLQQRPSFLNRKDIRIFTAASNDETLQIHRDERVTLIISQLDMPGMSSEQLCSEFRSDPALSRVSLIMVCAGSPAAIEQVSRCRPNAVVLRPINPGLLLAKAEQLLDISSRRARRVELGVAVGGSARVAGTRGPGNTAFFCRPEDLSRSGMMVESEEFLSEGDEVACSLILPDETRIQAVGTIVRSIRHARGDGTNLYGVKFTDLSGEGTKALEDFVDARAHPTNRSAA